MLGRIGKKIDDTVMYGVNKAVHAWNWTTGETKADISNNLLTIAPIVENSGFAMYFPHMLLFSLPALLSISHVQQIKNKRIEKLEVKALENGMRDIEVEEYKTTLKGDGYYWGAASGIHVLIPMDDEGTVIAGIGMGIRGLGCHVMRADYLPPRKNVFSRAKDRLADIVEKYQAEPSLKPAPSNL